MQSIHNLFEEYKNEERQLRDFIDLDSTLDQLMVSKMILSLSDW